MLKAGTDLFRAISILINDLDKPTLKALLIEIRANLEKGNQFFVVFARYPKYFSDVFVNLVKAGEASGSLTDILNNLSVSLGKEQELRNKIKAALIYPVILMGMSFLILILLTTYAIPKIANVFFIHRRKAAVLFQDSVQYGIVFERECRGCFSSYDYFCPGCLVFFCKNICGKEIFICYRHKSSGCKNVMKQYALQRFAMTFLRFLRPAFR